MHRAATSLIMKIYLYAQAVVVHYPRYFLIALFAHSSISRSTYTTYISRLNRRVTQHCIKDLSNRTFYIIIYKTFFLKILKRNKIHKILTYIPVTNLPLGFKKFCILIRE